MAGKTADATQFLLRLPKPLHRQMTQRAKRNNHSLNTEIVNQLEGHTAAIMKDAVKIAQPLLDGAVDRAAEAAGYTAAECVLAFIREVVPSPSEADLARGLAAVERLLATAHR